MYNEAFSRQKTEYSDPIRKASGRAEGSARSEENLQQAFDQRKQMESLSPENQKTSRDLEQQLHELLKKGDVIRLNEILRDPNLKQFISGQLQNEIFSELRSISMENVRGHIRDGNMGAVKEEMSGRLNEVQKGYADIFKRLAEELNKPEVLTEDRETITRLQGEVKEAETMVNQLLSSINNIQKAPVKVETMPPPLQSMEKNETTI